MMSKSMWTHSVLLASVAMAACDSTGTNRQGVSLSFTTQAPVAAVMQGSSSASFDVTLTNGTNTLVITKAQLVLKRIELKQSVTTTCTTTGEDNCEEMKIGPVLVDLPVTDGVASPVSATIPAGTYHEIEFEIRRPGSDSADQAFVTANPNFANASIRLEGTYNGTPFVFTSQVDQEVELEFNPPVVISDGTNNVTISVDLRSWFRNADGTLVNPATANPGQPNAGIVSERIKTSLRGFEDHDRNGRED